MTTMEALQKLISTSPQTKKDMESINQQIEDLLFWEVVDEIERLENEYHNDTLFIQLNQE